MIKSTSLRPEFFLGMSMERVPAKAKQRAEPVRVVRARGVANVRLRERGRLFYRVIYEQPETAREYELLRYVHGSELLFDPTLKDPRALKKFPVRVPGIVLHNDLDEDPRVFAGLKNPALANRVLHTRLSDKCEEHVFLMDAAPELAVKTVRGDMLWRQIGIDPTDPKPLDTNAEPLLAKIQDMLVEKFGRYILKPRKGYGSDGYLPTHKDDFVALWQSFRDEVLPAREEIYAETLDEDQRIERLYEELDQPESLVLEMLLRDPSSVIAQAFVEQREEIRVHIVEGHVLEGATTRRWWKKGAPLSPEDITSAETAVAKLCAVGPAFRELSCAPDVLLAKDGAIKVIDLNPGLQSGMYYPENDIWIANLLSAYFRGVETDYLRDMKALAAAPPADKPQLARALEAKIGKYVREHESYGFYDRLDELGLTEKAAFAHP